jgi:hypothetical protein
MAHVNRGVSCVSCHGKVNEMKVVHHDQPQSMSWCLDCHRKPEGALRPVDQVTNLDWTPSTLDRQNFYGELLKQGAKPEQVMQVLKGAKTAEPEGTVTLESILAAAKDKYGDQVMQEEVGLQLKKHWQIHPPESCGACHR